MPAIYKEYMPGLSSSAFLSVKTLFQLIQKGMCMGLSVLNSKPKRKDDFTIGNRFSPIPNSSGLLAEIKLETDKYISTATAMGNT